MFPRLFFPAPIRPRPRSSPATFALAFVARPIGSALFGHFGDRVGRKTTLVAALLTMGISTVVIGMLPTHATIGVAAPALLALCRIGQGLGLGGEWGGAVLLAVENAPPGKRAVVRHVPAARRAARVLLSNGVFLVLSRLFTNDQFFAFGWRIPFLASAVLVIVGLYAPDDLGNTGLSAGGRTARTREDADADGVPRVSRAARSRYPDFDVRLCALLLHDGLRAVVGHFDLRYPRDTFLIMHSSPSCSLR